MSAPADSVAVDVVVVNRNYARFLSQALDSACAQSHPNVRVIAVDDGSEDGSREVLARYKGRAKLLTKEHGGQASALNAGIEHCDGDLLLPLDADDVLLPDAAARVAAAFAADPALAKIQFKMAVVDAVGRRTGAVKPAPHLRAPSGDLRAAELAYPFDLPWLPGGGTAFPLRRLRRILPIPAADYPRAGADWYLVHLAALLGPVTALDAVCAEYRAHGANAYELERTSLDLDHVRDSIEFAAVTARHLEGLADELGLVRPARILSVSDLANRLISLRLQPQLHPRSEDSVGSLLAASRRAIGRRSDVATPIKALYAGWFVAMAAAPRPAAVRIAELLMFPERRRSLNGLLGKLQSVAPAGD